MSHHPNLDRRSPATEQDLRQQIVASAAELFDARGYWDTPMEDICLEAGLDMATVTSVFPNKYSLFRETVLGNARGLLAATEIGTVVPQDARQARATLNATIDSLAAAMVDRRTNAGFIRGEERYLNPDDRRELAEINQVIRGRVAAVLRRVRPELSEEDSILLTTGALSSLSVALAAPSSLPDAKLQTMLTVSATRVLENESALGGPIKPFKPKNPRPWMRDRSMAGRVIASTIALICERGFSAVAIDDVARAARVPKFLIRRKVSNMADLLSACFGVGGGELRVALTAAAEAAGPVPRDILLAMVRAYIICVFTDPQLMKVYLLDSHHLPKQYAEPAAALHEEFMAGWLECLLEIRPELAPAEATIAVYSALRLVDDLGDHFAWSYDDHSLGTIEKLVVATFLGGR